MILPSCKVARYNTVLIDPTVRVALRHFARVNPEFASEEFIRKVSEIESFPSVSVKKLIQSVTAAGVSVTGACAKLEEVQNKTPFLTYLKRGSLSLGSDLVRVEEVRQRAVVIGHDRFGADTIPREAVESRWTGVVILSDNLRSNRTYFPEIEDYKNKVSVKSGFVSSKECSDIIEYCESQDYRRSRIAERRSGIISDVVSIKTRSSSSVVLKDRNNPLVAELYRRCANIEGLPEDSIETIQSVRYKKGQRFRTHFDGGVGLPRLTTFLLYLNEDFDGGETYFPMLDKAILPKTGSCLRFPSCMSDGRVIWQSEHGGLPVTDGVKYALNIWVRCPGTPAPS